MTDYHRHLSGLVAPNDVCLPEVCDFVHPVIVLDPEGDGPDVMVELERRRWAHTGSASTLDRWREVLTEYASPKPPKPTPIDLLREHALVRMPSEGLEWLCRCGDGGNGGARGHYAHEIDVLREAGLLRSDA